MPNERGNDGFTLLEVLVALAILGASLTAVLMSLSNHRAWRARSEARLHLARTADALLQRVGLDIPLRQGQASGESDNLQWIIAMTAHDVRMGSMGNPQLYGVRVTVSSRASGDRVVLTTLRPGRR